MLDSIYHMSFNHFKITFMGTLTCPALSMSTVVSFYYIFVYNGMT